MTKRTLTQRLLAQLEPGDTVERCGLVVNGKVRELKNIHLDPAKGFRIDPAQLLKYVGKATATWHTHPFSSPDLSEEDYAGFSQWPQLVHHIVGYRDGVPSLQSYAVDDGLVVNL